MCYDNFVEVTVILFVIFSSGSCAVIWDSCSGITLENVTYYSFFRDQLLKNYSIWVVHLRRAHYFLWRGVITVEWRCIAVSRLFTLKNCCFRHVCFRCFSCCVAVPVSYFCIGYWRRDWFLDYCRERRVSSFRECKGESFFWFWNCENGVCRCWWLCRVHWSCWSVCCVLDRKWAGRKIWWFFDFSEQYLYWKAPLCVRVRNVVRDC